MHKKVTSSLLPKSFAPIHFIPYLVVQKYLLVPYNNISIILVNKFWQVLGQKHVRENAYSLKDKFNFISSE